MHNSISLLLEKYKNIQDPKDVRKKIASVISEQIGYEVSEHEIVFLKDKISLKVNNYLRTEIFIHKENLLDKLKQVGIVVTSLR